MPANKNILQDNPVLQLYRVEARHILCRVLISWASSMLICPPVVRIMFVFRRALVMQL